MAGYIGTQAVSVNTTSATISDDLAVGDDATITGDLDVDGTTNLDVVDIDGAVQLDSTLTVGVDDTGYDVKFFGATASAFMQWDASTDDLLLGGASRLGIGTAAPACNFHIKGDNPRLRVEGDDNTVKFDVFMGDSNPVVGTSSNHALVFMTNDADIGRFDTAGTLFLGTSTPTLHSNITGIVLDNGSLMTEVARGAGKSLTLAQNLVIDSGNTFAYLATDEGSYYQQFAGGHFFATTPSGSAGADATLTNKLTIINGGNVGINIDAPLDLLHLNDPNDDCVLNLDTAIANKNSIIKFSDPDAQGKAFIQYAHSNDVLRFNLSGSEKFKIAGTGLTDFFSSTTAIRIRTGGTGTSTQILSGSNGASNIDDGTEAIVIFASGNIQNTNNSYGSLSDEKIKENIVDATDKLNDIKKVKIRNFNIIGDSTKQIGVVAQELETVFPGLVDAIKDPVDENAVDADGNQIETETKSVKYSVFVPILIKAMQEQQTLIEALTDRITALEG